MNTIQFYTKFINDSNLLANGYNIIRNYLLQNQSNRENTLSNILLSSPPIITLISNVYPYDVFPLLNQQQKQMTRTYLINILCKCICENGVKNRNTQNILQFIHKIHNNEGYQKWLSLYATLIQNIPNNQFSSFILYVLSQSDNRISTLSTQIFVYVIQNNQKYSLSVQQMLQILFYCIKSFSYLCGTDDQQLNKYYKPYQQMLIKFIWTNIKNSPLAMRYSLKLLTILYADMNLAELDSQYNINNIQKLGQFGIQIIQQYIKIINNINYHSENIQQQQQNTNKQQQQSLHTNISLILYQLLQLYDILLHNQQQYNINMQATIITIIMSALPTKNDIQYWYKNSDIYFIALQDQYQKTLRNRASSILVSLIQQNNNKQQIIKIFKQYVTSIAIITHKNPSLSSQQSINLLQQSLLQKYNIKLSLSQYLSILPFQQSLYFLLSSCLSLLYKEQQYKNILYYIINRCKNINNILIKIQLILLYVNQSKSYLQEQFILFIIDIVNNEKSMYENGNIGLALVLARGIAKICYNNNNNKSNSIKNNTNSNINNIISNKQNKYIIINQTIPIQYLNLLITYLHKSTTKPDQDATHIVLQLLLKLSQTSQYNKKILQKQIINEQLQLFMINNYMHDGLLATIVIQLLQRFPKPNIMECIVNIIMGGGLSEEKYADLLVKWVKMGYYSLNQMHIQVLLAKYKDKRRDMINPIIKLYLSILHETQNKPTNENIINLLNINPDQSWLVLMLQIGILLCPQNRLINCIKLITQQITSQYQLQCKLILPYYLGIYEINNMLKVIQKYNQNKLFSQFIQKLYRYAKLFQGEHLKIITSLFMLNITQVCKDKTMKQKTFDLINGYGKLEINQWEDQQIQDNDDIDIDNQQDIIERLIGGKLENQEMEIQLKNVFKQLAWNSQLVKQKVKQIQLNGI